MTDWLNRCHFGDVRAVLRRMARDGVQVDMIITSPPYWGLRSYLPAEHPLKDKELGSEPTLAEFVKNMAGVFDLARKVLKPEGTLWVNMGDSHATDHIPAHSFRRDKAAVHPRKRDILGFKDKDLLGQPWRLALELQRRGWWLRSDIVWDKPNPMPESAKDRPTRAHEYLFLLAKSETYYFDFEAWCEPTTGGAHPRARPGPDGRGAPASLASMEFPGAATRDPESRRRKPVAGWADGEGVSHSPIAHAQLPGNGVGWGYADANPKPRTAHWSEPTGDGHKAPGRQKVNLPPYAATLADWSAPLFDGPKVQLANAGDNGRIKSANMNASLLGLHDLATRNRRTVWRIPTEPYHGAHFATFPRKLVEPPILAGCPKGGTVLDIFMGSGTTAQVAQDLGRNWIGIDLDDRNAALQHARTAQRPLDLSPDESDGQISSGLIVNAEPVQPCRTALTDKVGSGYSPEQEAADLETISRIEDGRQDYFEGMAEIDRRAMGPDQ